MSTAVPIRCVCPTDGELRHPDGDVVMLKDKLGFRDATAIRTEAQVFAIAEPDATTADSLAIFAEGYILHGVESWTLEEDGPKGKPIPMPASRANIRTYILEDWELADIVSTVADDLYAESVILPLLNRASPSSPPTPTNGSTSPRRSSGRKRPTQSKRSSISTIPTAATVTITGSPDGDSKSLRNSVTAA